MLRNTDENRDWGLGMRKAEWGMGKTKDEGRRKKEEEFMS